MKNKRITYMAMSVSVAFLLYISWSVVGYMQTNTESADLSFKGYANKATFVLGEPVSVEFEFSNNGKTSLAVHKLGVENGILKIFVANKDGEYKRFWGYGWGQVLGRMLSLAPGKSYRYKDVTILYQGKIETEGLSEKAAQAKLEGNITTEYAFPEPGVYFIKGLSSYADKTPSFGKDSPPIEVKSIESEPIKITVIPPTGEDLEVWNQIKGNAEIALLMQNGAFNTGKDAKKEQLMTQVEQIIVQYPNSIYSDYLKPNLEKYKAHQIVLKESLKRAIIKPNN